MHLYSCSSVMTDEQLRKQLLRQEEQIKLLKQMIAIENKEKYDAYNRIKELTDKLNKKD